MQSHDEESFDAYDEFRPDHLPEPGPFLAGADVLTGDDHLAFHRLTRDVFADRGVYEVSFGYNLARLNLDARHPDAGFRYARASDDPTTLLAEFTPPTESCPKSGSLTVGAFRAWNGLADRHEYDHVSVAIAPRHHRAVEINERLRALERDGDAGENGPDRNESIIGMSEINLDISEGNENTSESGDDDLDLSLPF